MNVSAMIEGSYPSTSIPRSLAIAVSVMLSMLILAGAFGNAFVCNRLRRRRDLRKVPHYLLANLSLTGLLTSLLGMPSLLLATIVNYRQASHSPVAEILCKVGFPLSIGCIALNALSLTLMTIDRHDCVVRPFRRRLSRENVKKILLVTWLLAFLISGVLLVLLRKERSVCYTWFPYNQLKSLRTKQGHVILNYITAIAQLDTLAIVLIIVSLFRVVKTLRAPTILQSTNSSFYQRQEKQLTWLTYKLCGTYILFRFPFLICSIVGRNEEFQGTALNTASLLTGVTMYSPFVLNPILHFKMLRVRQPNRVVHVVPQAPQAQLRVENTRSDE